MRRQPAIDDSGDDFIHIPAAKVRMGDLMDRAMDKLRTVHLALSPDNKTWFGDDELASAWVVIEQAIKDLEPVRNRLQGVDGAA